VGSEPLHAPIESLPAGLDAGELHQPEQLGVRNEPGMKHFLKQRDVALIVELDVSGRVPHATNSLKAIRAGVVHSKARRQRGAGQICQLLCEASSRAASTAWPPADLGIR